jgi:NAD(P)-dependent dehydrogenase (short-subunit alcohol dehydrogenase family)
MGSTDGVAVVTGAAGGMGSAIAHALANEGSPLLLCDLRAAPLDALAARLGRPDATSVLCGDITAADYPARIASTLGNRKIAVLAHAAGVSPSMTNGQRIFEINFAATKRLVEGLLPQMAEGGAIVLIASNSGQLVTNPIFDYFVKRLLRVGRSLVVRSVLRSPRLAYPISKRAVQLYAQAMAPTCGKTGVRIVSLSPGIIDTEMGRLEQSAIPEMDKMIALTPLPRMGTAAEIASVVAFLASPAASFINGTDILVDGGCVAAINQAGGPRRALR